VSPSSSRHYPLYFLCLSILVGVVSYLFYPVVAMFPQPVAVSAYPDFLEFVWTSWRLDKVLAGVEPLYSTQLIFAPNGSSLLLHTSSEGVLLPVSMVLHQFSPVWRINFTFLMLVVVNTISVFSLMRSTNVGVVLAFLFSLLVGLGPFVMGHLHAGHINFLILFPFFEAVHGLHKILFSGRQPISKVILLRYLCAVLLLPFTNLYYLYFFGLVGIFYASAYIVIATKNERSPHGNVWNFFSRLRIVCLLTLLGCSPTIPHLLDIATVALSRTYTPDHNPGAHAATFSNFLVPSSLQQIHTVWESFSPIPFPRLHVGESALYVPYSIILLGLFFSICRPGYTSGHKKHLILAMFFFLVSFGPKFSVLDRGIISNPIDWVFRTLLPLFPSVPARFGGFGSLFLIYYVAGCSVQATKRELRYFVVPLLILACAEVFPVQVTPHRLQDFTGLSSLITKDVGGEVVVDITIPAQSAMYRQTFHGRKIVGGFLSRRPKQIERTLRRNSFARFMRGEVGASNEELLRAWCSLGGDILLAPLASVDKNINLRLENLGFSLFGYANDFAVLKRTGTPCPTQ
jgi:hypothetical protein